jgi:apolipoprotein D and lipocalin family protein
MPAAGARAGLGFALAGVLLFLGGCQAPTQPEIDVVEDLDLQRFMGDWYVVGNIPTFLEKGAHNAVESYELVERDKVATTFRFRKDDFDGPEKVYHPTGFVSRESNAVWGMQFLWPIKAEYLVIYIDPGYQRTIIGRSKRDYVWLMARSPDLSDADYQEMVDAAVAAGYDAAQIQRIPHRWPEA